MSNDKLKRNVLAALFGALTFVATAAITFPTPTLGYVHMGDTIVLLSGIFFGPVLGGLVAGIGSLLADLILGYTTSAIPTLIIKFVTAAIAGLFFKKKENAPFWKRLLFLSIAEINMVFGYFLYHVLKLPILNAEMNLEGFKKGFLYALTGIPFDAMQGLVGVVGAIVLLPLIRRLMKQ